jgi:hypothetical protein
MSRKALFPSLLFIAAALLSGCAFLNKEQGYIDDKPQNRPVGWERGSGFGL